MTRTEFVFAVSLPLMAGCDSATQIVTDQCLRAELFKQCMASLPPGPVQSHYSDWDEVVDSCENAAYWQAKRQIVYVKSECVVR
jgi:hypothetical protein